MVLLSWVIAVDVRIAVGATVESGARPIRWVVPQPPGSASDTMARVVAQKLSEQWGRAIIVDNRAGANGIIGASLVAKSAPDGLTWLNAYLGNHATNPALYKTLPYDHERDFATVCVLGVVPYVAVSSLPVSGLQEFISLAKNNPGTLMYGGPTGSVNHLIGAMLNSAAGVNVRYIPYKLAIDAVIDSAAGRISIAYTSVTAAASYVRSNKLRALAITSARRTAVMPDVPTVAELGYPGFDVAPWFGILVRSGTPTAIIQKINTDVNRLLGMKEISDRFAGAEPLITTSEQFGKILKDDTIKWGKMIKELGLNAE